MDSEIPSPESIIDAAGDQRPVDLKTALSIQTWVKRSIPPAERFLGDLMTNTSRTFFVGKTGIGKTNFGFALAEGIASGAGFLHWRSSRPARVLYIDGETSAELIKSRSVDALRRSTKHPRNGMLMIYSRDYEEQIEKQFPVLGKMPALNTLEGHEFVLRLIKEVGGVDVVIFDNLMSLCLGIQKDEGPFNEAMPLIEKLTAARIGQAWFDHAGWDDSKQYGSSTKSWRFDSVGIMTPVKDDDPVPHDMAFQLTFDHPGKARRRMSANWNDFATTTIRLRDDRWTSDMTPAKKAGWKLSGAEKEAVDILNDLMADGGASLPIGDGFPTNGKGVAEAAWKKACSDRRVSTSENDKDRGRVIGKVYQQLLDKGIISACGGWVWPVAKTEDRAGGIGDRFLSKPTPSIPPYAGG